MKRLAIRRSDIQKRFCQTAIKYAVILCIGLAYFLLVRSLGKGIPCLFYEITGWKCPGCGITGMILSLARADFAAAFAHNPFLFITGPFILIYLLFCEIRYVLRGTRRMGKWEIFIWVELGLAILFGLLRNIFVM
jgi:hypothetical protein